MSKTKKHDRTPISTGLRLAIENSGKTGHEIAKEAGVAQPIVSRFLSGERGLGIASTDKLADYFGLELVSRLGSK